MLLLLQARIVEWASGVGERGFIRGRRVLDAAALPFAFGFVTPAGPGATSAVPIGNGGHTKATPDLFSRQMTAGRAGGRCDVPTPTKSPVSRPCSLPELMPSSAESGAGPSLRAAASGTKRRVKFGIEDVGSDASRCKSRKGDQPMIGYEAMQLQIAHRKR